MPTVYDYIAAVRAGDVSAFQVDPTTLPARKAFTLAPARPLPPVQQGLGL